MVMQGMIEAKGNVETENWWARQDLNRDRPTDYESRQNLSILLVCRALAIS